MDIATDMCALNFEAGRHASVETNAFTDVEVLRASQDDSHLVGIVVPVRGKSP